VIPNLTYDRTARTVTDERFQQKDITLLRPVFGSEVLGVQGVTFELPLSIRCIVQPASGDDLELLPEGERLNNVQAVWSTIALYVGNGRDRDSDVLEIDGVRFSVVKMFNRRPNGYWKVLAEGYVHG
jgi:hypothetical protein